MPFLRSIVVASFLAVAAFAAPAPATTTKVPASQLQTAGAPGLLTFSPNILSTGTALVNLNLFANLLGEKPPQLSTRSP